MGESLERHLADLERKDDSLSSTDGAGRDSYDLMMRVADAMRRVYGEPYTSPSYSFQAMARVAIELVEERAGERTRVLEEARRLDLTDEEIELAASALEFASTYALQPDLAADELARKLRASLAAVPGGGQRQAREDGARVHLLAWMDLARSNLAPWPEVRRLHSNLLAQTEAFLESSLAAVAVEDGERPKFYGWDHPADEDEEAPSGRPVPAGEGGTPCGERSECQLLGHDFDIMLEVGKGPVEIRCARCDASWIVAPNCAAPHASAEILRGEFDYSSTLGELFVQLLAAAQAVPVKQRRRTPEQQAAVEAFTTAIVEARRFVRGPGGTP